MKKSTQTIVVSEVRRDALSRRSLFVIERRSTTRSGTTTQPIGFVSPIGRGRALALKLANEAALDPSKIGRSGVEAIRTAADYEALDARLGRSRFVFKPKAVQS